MITHLIALVVGFVAGALVFRNNVKKAGAIVDTAKALADKAKECCKK